jgi:hypothetical protein
MKLTKAEQAIYQTNEDLIKHHAKVISKARAQNHRIRRNARYRVRPTPMRKHVLLAVAADDREAVWKKKRACETIAWLKANEMIADDVRGVGKCGFVLTEKGRGLINAN